jgi:hypothetical protein
MATIRKGQIRDISGGDVRIQAALIAELFEVAA